MNKAYAVMFSKFRGERIPTITTIQSENRYEKDGYNLEEAKEVVLNWLTEQMKVVENITEGDIE